MSNGEDMINEMNYREKIEAMPAAKLRTFTAMQVYETNITVKDHEGRILKLEHPSRKKQLTFGTTILAATSSVLYALGSKCGWWA